MNAPIGVFDSGLGGLSVAARISEELPDESVLYFADNAHVPYGERPLDEIRGFALEITRYLIEQGCKAVVMACNMSSAIALEAARQRHPEVPILGMIEPGAAAAVRAANGKPIGVLATTGTVKSEAYVRTIASLDSSARVHQQACPAFVPLVEDGLAESQEADAAARTYVNSLLECECGTLILGCTHYPFLRGAISRAAGPHVTIVDPAEETARLLKNTLLERRLVSQGAPVVRQFVASGDTTQFAGLGGAFLGEPIGMVQHVEWGVDLGVHRDALLSDCR